jgi:hypothetical protein
MGGKQYETFTVDYEKSDQLKQLLKEIFNGFQNKSPLNTMIDKFCPIAVILNWYEERVGLRLENRGASNFCVTYMDLNLSSTSLNTANALRRLMEMPNTVLRNNERGLNFEDLVDFLYSRTIHARGFLSREQVDEVFKLYVNAAYSTPEELHEICELHPLLLENHPSFKYVDISCVYNGKIEGRTLKKSIFDFLLDKDMIDQNKPITIDSSGSNIRYTEKEEIYGQWLWDVYREDSGIISQTDIPKATLGKVAEMVERPDNSLKTVFSKIFKNKNHENLSLEF